MIYLILKKYTIYETRKEMWNRDEYRIDFDSIAWKLNK